jgi:cytochrome c peroxidase
VKRILAIALCPILLISCIQDTDFLDPLEDELYSLELPAGFPEPDIPADNELTNLRIELGKRLFFDTRLSRDLTVSCGSCHLQEIAFTDGLALSQGIEGRIGPRNAPTLTNVVYNERFFMDGGVPSLELQVLAPIHDENEMDFAILEVLERLQEDANLSKLSLAAYGRKLDTYVLTRAIASFERTIISGNSPYDQYQFGGDEDALTSAEIRGKDLFFSDETNCGTCHTGFNLTDNDYHNIGLYVEYEDPGRWRITNDDADHGKFKVPTLRNVALTAPYMHDGSIGTLEEVIDFFAEGGVGHANQSELVAPMALSEQDKEDLVAFLESLTDQEFIENPTFKP